jgi:hypothetical protein
VDQVTSISERIAARLRQVRLEGFAAGLLEACAPLAVLGAQAAYIVEPFLGGAGPRASELARLLEDPGGIADLIERLREEGDGA